ncbi:MAG: alpha-D-ribose 1-methylphosphonate 5-triphosphate diphosphatase [Planktotalea sp.]|uniref:alpha-D-ribose 1-methylphosphonate 5-triphosphate diphosphatase n=1 Tax=Planktotalea sp. TaxID=2029877 RepID=UPI003C78D55F
MKTVELRFVGGEVLFPEGLSQRPLAIAGGVVCDNAVRVGVRDIDARGYRILPGIVDIHGDGFERHLAPRRGAMTDMHLGIASAETDLACNGITTAVMAQFYSWEGGLRAPEFARKFLDALTATRADHLTDMRAQLRIETHMIDDYADMLALIKAHEIGYVVFNDHIPHKRLDEGRNPPRLTGTALKSGRSPEAHLALMQGLHARSDAVPAALKDFAVQLSDAGCLLGSHDDTTIADRDMYRDMGAQISEFPETHEAALAARQTGAKIILGAPNVMRGGSHAGNVSAIELIREGLCDALASDYHYPALRQSIGKLVAQGACDFAQGWALLSSGPADVLGLSDRGTLAPGLRADLVVEEIATGRIAATISAGRISHLQGDFAARLLAA